MWSSMTTPNRATSRSIDLSPASGAKLASHVSISWEKTKAISPKYRKSIAKSAIVQASEMWL
jgi:hypothetical protein